MHLSPPLSASEISLLMPVFGKLEDTFDVS